ncbi:DUF86 domain-containing protein [Candidatus Woesearchaeota archaeon]|nr:DUF86 domain-containing protein [Candidatus Woesearchaeota archaeon]
MTGMMREKDKIKDLRRFLEELGRIVPKSVKEYRSNIEKKAACERYAERIIEALTDLAFLTIKNRKLRMPESDTDAFDILAENKIITDELCAKLKKAKGMRNIIAHEYGTVDDEIVFEAITKELQKDAKDFIRAVKHEDRRNL